MSWKPDPQGLNELIQCLKDAEAGDTQTQKAVANRLEAFTAVPDYTNYLAYIFTQCKNEPDGVRWRAGLTLKNNIRAHSDGFQPHVLAYLKSVIFVALADSSASIRNTAASVIDWLFRGLQPENWPEALNILMEMIDSNQQAAQEGAFKTLANICEEIPRHLEQLEIGGTRPFDFIVPKIINYIPSANPKIRVDALHCLVNFIWQPQPPNALVLHADAFLTELFKLANDTNTEVRKLLCQAMNALLLYWPDKITPALPNIVDFMLFSTQDEDDTIALTACEFWLTFAEEPELPQYLRPYLPKVVPVLLKGIVYSDTDVAVLDQDIEDASIPDKASDIKPQHYGGKSHGSHERFQDSGDLPSMNGALVKSKGAAADDDEDDEDDEDYDDEDDPYSEWTFRKCCAAAIDLMAVTFEAELLDILLPYLREELQSDDWMHREAGILTLGAIAEGCIGGISPHLPALMPFLFDSLNHPKPLVRSIACWTIGRYSSWCVNSSESPEHLQKYFVPAIEGLLRMVLDNNKRVQEAGCSAFATLEEEAADQLEPYLEGILRNLVLAFDKYQQKNLLILYDAIGTLADAVGSALNRPDFITILMPPLIARWQKLDDNNPDLIPLLECLSSVVVAVGDGFLPYAAPVFVRSVRLVHSGLAAYAAYQSNPDTVEEPDRTFLIVALDLLSGLTQGLGGQIEQLFNSSDPPLMPMLIACFNYPEAPVRQSAFALLGDIAISCFQFMKPSLPSIMPLVVRLIEPDAKQDDVSVCNNAAWSAGEIALKCGADMESYVPQLMERLVPILMNQKAVRSLMENSAVTIGRLGLVCPSVIAPNLGVFMRQWCGALAEIKDNDEKDTAFRGICMVIQQNPNGVAECFGHFLNAVVRWQRPSPQLNEMFSNILVAFKEMSGTQQWEAQMQQLPAQIPARLRERYGV